MTLVNFRGVPDATLGAVIPDDTYQFRIIEADDTKLTKESQTPMLCLKLEVIAGDFKGTHIYDNVVFSKGGLPKLKMLCKAAGINIEGEVDVRGRDLLKKIVFAKTRVETYNSVDRSKIPFDGYSVPQEAVGDEQPVVSDESDDLPF